VAFCVFWRELLINIFLWLPIIYSFALLPQLNTFSMYLIEVINIYVFGSSAHASLGATFIDFSRSIIISFICFGFAYLSNLDQFSLVYSVFCGVLVSLRFVFSLLLLFLIITFRFLLFFVFGF
jgi:hypothetical protein